LERVDVVALIASASKVIVSDRMVSRRKLFIVDQHSQSSLILFVSSALTVTFKKCDSIKLSKVVINVFKGEKNLLLDAGTKFTIEDKDPESRKMQTWRKKQNLDCDRFMELTNSKIALLIVGKHKPIFLRDITSECIKQQCKETGEIFAFFIFCSDRVLF